MSSEQGTGDEMKTRVFVSSTCYDLRQIRRDLEDFIEGMGYQPIMSDSHNIAIPAGLDTEGACKWLIAESDLFILIIGGRYGWTPGSGEGIEHKDRKSITNIEYETAFELGMPIYTFVDDEVWKKRDVYDSLSELVEAGSLPEENLDSALGPKIDDYRVFEFIKRVSGAKRDGWIHEFSKAQDIIARLKNNWSLQFRELLRGERGPGAKKKVAEARKPELEVYWHQDQDIAPNELHYRPATLQTVESAIEELRFDYRHLVESINDFSWLMVSEYFAYHSDDTQRNYFVDDNDKRKSKNSFIGDIEDELNWVLENLESGKLKYSNYMISSRLAPYGFRVSNIGNAVAKDVLLYVRVPEGVRAYDSYSDVFKDESEVSNLAYLIEDLRMVKLAKDERIEDYNIVLPDRNPFPPTKRRDGNVVYNFQKPEYIEADFIKFNFGDIKHNMISFMSKKYLQLLIDIEPDVKSLTFEWTAYVDNLPTKVTGTVEVALVPIEW